MATIRQIRIEKLIGSISFKDCKKRYKKINIAARAAIFLGKKIAERKKTNKLLRKIVDETI